MASGAQSYAQMEEAAMKQCKAAAIDEGEGAGDEMTMKKSSPMCPRCESTNTKFCYFNNYSLSQPRYFCKDCRRYWTKGGSLRNVPVGGGCRKAKRAAASSSSSSSPAPPPPPPPPMQLPHLPSNSAAIINKLMQPTAADFPNVLPTFVSTGLELPAGDHLGLAFGAAPGGGSTGTSSFMDMLRGVGGGLLFDGSCNDHQMMSSFNGYCGPAAATGGDGINNRMVMPLPPSTLLFGGGGGGLRTTTLMPPQDGLQLFGGAGTNHGTDHAMLERGAGLLLSMDGCREGQWPSLGGGRAGDQHVLMGAGDNSLKAAGSSSATPSWSDYRYSTWNSTAPTAAAATAAVGPSPPWQQGLIDSSTTPP
ncbi:hypothetical protein ABZP36_021375 [Zizania latifolia]